jgi:LCP family protein required for cell wall assembly
LVAKLSIAVIAIAVLAVTGFTWGTNRWMGVKFRQVAALDQGSSAIVDAAMQRGDDNFLVIGLDNRPGADAENPAGAGRSDTAMLVHIPQDRGRVVVLSLPVDLQVDRPACEAWDQAAGRYTGQRDQGQAKVQLGAVYRHGGPRCATSVVQQVSGLAINHFVSIESSGFTALINTMGGVEVCVDQPVKDDVRGEVVAKPGRNELDGAKALAFVRASQAADDPAAREQDGGQIRRQQELLAALVRSAASAQTLSNSGKLGRLIDVMAANTFVDNVDARLLKELAGSWSTLDPGKVMLVTVPTDADGDHRTLRSADATALFRAIIDGAPLAGDKPEDTPQPSGEQVTTVPPNEIKLQVVNGTGTEGLATQVAKRLRSVGFEIVKMDNAPQRVDRTMIRYAASHEQQARSVAAAIPRAVLRLDPAMGGAIEVELGGDFDGAVESVRLGEPVPPRPVEQDKPDTPRLDMRSAADTLCT